TFASMQKPSPAVGNQPAALAAGDIMHDSQTQFADLVVANGADATVSVLVNTDLAGKRGFVRTAQGQNQDLVVGGGPNALALGRAANPLLVVSNAPATTLSVFKGNGQGSFTALDQDNNNANGVNP